MKSKTKQESIINILLRIKKHLITNRVGYLLHHKGRIEECKCKGGIETLQHDKFSIIKQNQQRFLLQDLQDLT